MTSSKMYITPTHVKDSFGIWLQHSGINFRSCTYPEGTFYIEGRGKDGFYGVFASGFTTREEADAELDRSMMEMHFYERYAKRIEQEWITSKATAIHEHEIYRKRMGLKCLSKQDNNGET